MQEKMTHEEYHEAIDLCCQAAGSDEDWNKKFLNALEANGLMLVFKNPFPHEDGNDYMAPVPTDGPDAYQYPSWIIPKPFRLDDYSTRASDMAGPAEMGGGS